MKKLGITLLSFALLMTVVSGCSSSSNSNSGGSTDKAKLSVYTSFYPMYDFAKKIGGDKIELTNLVPAGTEPHEWEPTANDITNLEKANVFIYNGAGMEHWVEKVVGSLENKELVSVEASKGLTLLAGHHDEDEERENGEVKENEDREEESATDPHVWMSIRNAKQEMKNIKDALVKADQTNAGYYEKNYITYAAEFDALDNEFKTTISGLKNKSIVVAHEAFGYICADYGLTQVGIEGLSADSEPDPARMAEIIKFAKDNKVKTIFFEELVSPKVAETVASELGAKTDMLNPLEGLTDEQLTAGEDYISIMKSNLEALKAALQ